jgi:hypothetical protein
MNFWCDALFVIHVPSCVVSILIRSIALLLGDFLVQLVVPQKIGLKRRLKAGIVRHWITTFTILCGFKLPVVVRRFGLTIFDI